MNARKRLMRMAQDKQQTPENAPYPLPEGKSETLNYRGELRLWNVQTGKYDIKA